MKVRVDGENPYISRAEIRYAIRWMGRRLFGVRKAKNVDLHLWFKHIDGQVGDMWPRRGNLRKFSIRIEPGVARRKFLTILAHEMVHCSQYVRDDMKDYATHTRWKSSLYDWDYTENDNYWAYQVPWEREAYRRQAVLYRGYRRHLKRVGLNFSGK